MHSPISILNVLEREEELDFAKPLRRFMDVENDLVPPSLSSTQLLSFLPEQAHSMEDGILRLSFSPETSSPLTLDLAIDASPGCGGVAWPAGQVLATYLVRKGADLWQGRKILELGSGTGLVGLVAGMLRGKVWLTDQLPLLSIMKQNILINNLSSNVTVAELNWGLPIPTDMQHPDLILAADCIYFEPAFPLLIQTLSDLSDPTTEILLCYKKRRKADKRFFAMLKKQFTWKEVTDDPNRPMYSREAISLLRLSKIN